MSRLKSQGRTAADGPNIICCLPFTLQYWKLNITILKSKLELKNCMCPFLLSPFFLHPVQLLLSVPKFLMVSLHFSSFRDNSSHCYAPPFPSASDFLSQCFLLILFLIWFLSRLAKHFKKSACFSTSQNLSMGDRFQPAWVKASLTSRCTQLQPLSKLITGFSWWKLLVLHYLEETDTSLHQLKICCYILCYSQERNHRKNPPLLNDLKDRLTHWSVTFGYVCVLLLSSTFCACFSLVT